MIEQCPNAIYQRVAFTFAFIIPPFSLFSTGRGVLTSLTFLTLDPGSWIDLPHQPFHITIHTSDPKPIGTIARLSSNITSDRRLNEIPLDCFGLDIDPGTLSGESFLCFPVWRVYQTSPWHATTWHQDQILLMHPERSRFSAQLTIWSTRVQRRAMNHRDDMSTSSRAVANGQLSFLLWCQSCHNSHSLSKYIRQALFPSILKSSIALSIYS